MADKHPYVPGPGGLVQVINHFRRSFPATVSADTLRKLGYAPKNESYVLNVLRHLELIDEDGQRTASAQRIFSLHDDAAFAKEFADVVKKAYSGLFELHKDDSWTLDQGTLITFFRSEDQTTAIVGKRQAATFQLLAGFAGQKEVPEARPRKKAAAKNDSGSKAVQSRRRGTGKREAPTTQLQDSGLAANSASTLPNIGLTVRIEINLPADGDQETYDRIFKSIRENLLNG